MWFCLGICSCFLWPPEFLLIEYQLISYVQGSVWGRKFKFEDEWINTKPYGASAAMEQALSAFGVPGEKSGRPGFRCGGARSLRGLCRHGGHKHGHPLEDPGIVMLGIQGASVLFFFF